MKSIVKWFAKKYALDAVKDAVAAKSDTVRYWAGKASLWLGRARLVVAFLERLNERLTDGALTDDEANRTVEEAETLIKAVMA